MRMVRFGRRRWLTTGAAMLTATLGGKVYAQQTPPLPTERPIGLETAPVTVIEYHSLTCGNCARFHTEIFPAIRRTYVDTGRVRFVLRDYPLDRIALEAAILAHCAGPDRYQTFISALYQDKERWAHSADPLSDLRRIGVLGGVPNERFEACRSNRAFVDAILAMRLGGDREYRVSGTPTFVINGNVHTGVLTFEQFARIVDPLLRS